MSKNKSTKRSVRRSKDVNEGETETARKREKLTVDLSQAATMEAKDASELDLVGAGGSKYRDIADRVEALKPGQCFELVPQEGMDAAGLRDNITTGLRKILGNLRQIVSARITRDGNLALIRMPIPKKTPR